MDKATLLQLGADEAAERPIRHSAIEILDYTPSRRSGPMLAREGTVTVFVGREGADVIRRVRGATGTDGADVELANYLIDAFRGRLQLTRYRAWSLLRHSPVFADVRYGGQTLATHVFPPPDVEVVVLENPYNGAPLDPSHLTLVEHPRDGASERLEAVALRHAPPLHRGRGSSSRPSPN